VWFKQTGSQNEESNGTENRTVVKVNTFMVKVRLFV